MDIQNSVRRQVLLDVNKDAIQHINSIKQDIKYFTTHYAEKLTDDAVSLSTVTSVLDRLRNITSVIRRKTELVDSAMRAIDFVYYSSDTGVVPANIVLATIGDNNINSLPSCLFHNKYNLRCVTIPFNVTRIGSRIFENCTRLSSVNLHPLIESIGTGAFDQCSSLKQIFVPTSLKYLEFRVFASCALETVELPPSILSIEKWAFKDCRQLIDLKINSSFININEEAVVNCDNLIGIQVSTQTRCVIISRTEANKRAHSLVNNRIMKLRDHLYNELVLGDNARMKAYTTDNQKTISIILDMVGIDGREIVRNTIRKYTKFVVMIDWKLCSKCHSKRTGRSPLFSAAFSCLQLETGLSDIFEGNPRAIYERDPRLRLEAFMVAAIGKNSKLSSVYYLLKQYPQVINWYVTPVWNLTEEEKNPSKKRKLY